MAKRRKATTKARHQNYIKADGKCKVCRKKAGYAVNVYTYDPKPAGRWRLILCGPCKLDLYQSIQAYAGVDDGD